MDAVKELEDKLREAAGIGDEETICNILDNDSVNVNSQHSINGWTALHWAAHRGHYRLAAQLLNHGADKSIGNIKEETPLQLASDPNTRLLLGGESNGEVKSSKENIGFVPNYLAHPPFPHIMPAKERPINASMQQNPVMMGGTDQYIPTPVNATSFNKTKTNELVIKARVSNAAETDFIEVDLERDRLTFDSLVSILCSELDVKQELVRKVRKLPDTIVRNINDIKRFVDFQEIELVLTNRAISESSRNYGPSVSPKHVDVVY